MLALAKRPSMGKYGTQQSLTLTIDPHSVLPDWQWLNETEKAFMPNAKTVKHPI
jgi:hypothetical protein